VVAVRQLGALRGPVSVARCWWVEVVTKVVVPVAVGVVAAVSVMAEGVVVVLAVMVVGVVAAVSAVREVGSGRGV